MADQIIIQNHNSKSYEIWITQKKQQEWIFTVWEPGIYASSRDCFELALWSYDHPIHGMALAIENIDANKFLGEHVSTWLLPLVCKQTGLPLFSTGRSPSSKMEKEVRITEEAGNMWKRLIKNPPHGFTCGLDITVDRYYLIP